jgi:hypothetical protein
MKLPLPKVSSNHVFCKKTVLLYIYARGTEIGGYDDMTRKITKRSTFSIWTTRRYIPEDRTASY